MILGAVGMVAEALKFSVGHGVRNFGILAGPILLAMAACWALVYVLRPDSAIAADPQMTWLALFIFFALLLVWAVTGLHRAAFMPEDRLPYVPVLARPRGLSVFEPLRMTFGHVLLLVVSGTVVWFITVRLPVLGLPGGAITIYSLSALLGLSVLWLSARFLTYPAQLAAENRLSPTRSLTLSRGMTMRFCLTLVFAWVVFGVLSALYAGIAAYFVLPIAGGRIGSVDQVSIPIQVTLIITLMLYLVLALGYWAGLSAAAYRSAVTKDVG